MRCGKLRCQIVIVVNRNGLQEVTLNGTLWSIMKPAFWPHLPIVIPTSKYPFLLPMHFPNPNNIAFGYICSHWEKAFWFSTPSLLLVLIVVKTKAKDMQLINIFFFYFERRITNQTSSWLLLCFSDQTKLAGFCLVGFYVMQNAKCKCKNKSMTIWKRKACSHPPHFTPLSIFSPFCCLVWVVVPTSIPSFLHVSIDQRLDPSVHVIIISTCKVLTIACLLSNFAVHGIQLIKKKKKRF